jgi:predicted PurR-regulated permease PerM
MNILKGIFNNRIKQLLLLALIIIIGYVIIYNLKTFIPGFLGAITLYILSRKWYFILTEEKKWKKGWTAMLFILGGLVCFVLPVWMALHLLIPKVQSATEQSDKIIPAVEGFLNLIKERTGIDLLRKDTLTQIAEKLAGVIPALVNGFLHLLMNLFMMLFVFYFMITNARGMESYLSRFIPLKKENVHLLGEETIKSITANAFGIPLISIIQGFTAMIGYWIFGVHDIVLWGFLTGLFAFFPIVGTMVIWVPLVILTFMQGNEWQALGLLIWSLLITGNVDSLSRMTILRKLGDVHPLVTIFGVIAGLSIFGFVGLIFGPLLLSYFIILIRIYMNEYVQPEEPEQKS